MFMLHSLLPIKFEPERSAFWLPKSGRLAASRLPTDRCWALRISFSETRDDSIWAPWLFVVSSFPSPHPVENASYRLGPRVVQETGAIIDGDADILTTVPLPTVEARASWPLYIHLVPALPINMYRCSVLKRTCATLTEDSLRTFHDGVARCVQAADKAIREAQETHSFKEIRNGWYAPRDDSDSDAYMFGEPSDPHKYVFDFGFDLPPDSGLPAFEGPSNLYDEIMLYNQLCKDYKWRGVNYTVEWLRNMRHNVAQGWVGTPVNLATPLPTEPCLDDESRKRAIELAALGNPHVRIASVLEDEHAKRVELAAARNTERDFTNSSESSEVLFLPGEFPHVPFRYPVVPFGPTKVVAFDVFGTILDRERAIEGALSSWFAQSPVRHRTTLALVVDRFVTLEALAERDARSAGSPTSFATFARSALLGLAQHLRLDIDVRSTLFTETLKCILSPQPYPEVEAAITALKQRGYMLVCLPTHSATTMQQLRPSFPPAFADDAVRIWTEYISTHFVASPALFTSFQSFCESLVGGTLQRSQVLIVSSGIGRVLHAAVYATHATAWVNRPLCLESTVEFIVGDDGYSCPVPSLVVGNLMDLVARL